MIYEKLKERYPLVESTHYGLRILHFDYEKLSFPAVRSDVNPLLISVADHFYLQFNEFNQILINQINYTIFCKDSVSLIYSQLDNVYNEYKQFIKRYKELKHIKKLIELEGDFK